MTAAPAVINHPLPVRQSPAIDASAKPDESWVRDKTIFITGGASGFWEGYFGDGAQMARTW